MKKGKPSPPPKDKKTTANPSNSHPPNHGHGATRPPVRPPQPSQVHKTVPHRKTTAGQNKSNLRKQTIIHAAVPSTSKRKDSKPETGSRLKPPEKAQEVFAEPDPEPRLIEPDPSKVKRRYDEFATIEQRSDYFRRKEKEEREQKSKMADSGRTPSSGIHDILNGHASTNIISRSGNSQHSKLNDGTLLVRDASAKEPPKQTNFRENEVKIDSTESSKLPAESAHQEQSSQSSQELQLKSQNPHPELNRDISGLKTDRNTHLQNQYSYQNRDYDDNTSPSPHGSFQDALPGAVKLNTRPKSSPLFRNQDHDDCLEMYAPQRRNSSTAQNSNKWDELNLEAYRDRTFSGNMGFQQPSTDKYRHGFPNGIDSIRSCDCSGWESRNFNTLSNSGRDPEDTRNKSGFGRSHFRNDNDYPADHFRKENSRDNCSCSAAKQISLPRGNYERSDGLSTSSREVGQKSHLDEKTPCCSDSREEFVISYKEEEIPYEVWVKTQAELSNTNMAAVNSNRESILQYTEMEIPNCTTKEPKLELNIDGRPVQSNKATSAEVKEQLQRFRMSEEAIKGVIESLQKLNK